MLEKICCFDLEADRERGLDVWSKHYKLESAAFLIKNKFGYQKHYTTDKEEIYTLLRSLKEKDYTFIVHNLNYEGGVLLAQAGIDITELSPDGELRVIDTMKLHQHTTKKQDEDRSLSLDAAVEEYSGSGHKGFYLNYLVNNGSAKNLKDAHARVSSLPPNLLKEYNMLDVEVTYDLFLHCMNYLDFIGYDWVSDHILYVRDVSRNLKTYIKGIKIDREAAYKNLLTLIEAKKKTELEFFETYSEVIKATQHKLSTEWLRVDFSTRKAKAKNPDKIEPKKEKMIEFNLNSTKHKEVLAIDVMGLEPFIFTEKGSPSFKKGNLHQYGELGSFLAKIAYFNKPILELQKVLALSAEDGRLHALVRASTTVTGRSSSKKSE